jgi:hypothetical protein
MMNVCYDTLPQRMFPLAASRELTRPGRSWLPGLFIGRRHLASVRTINVYCVGAEARTLSDVPSFQFHLVV